MVHSLRLHLQQQQARGVKQNPKKTLKKQHELRTHDSHLYQPPTLKGSVSWWPSRLTPVPPAVPLVLLVPPSSAVRTAARNLTASAKVQRPARNSATCRRGGVQVHACGVTKTLKP